MKALLLTAEVMVKRSAGNVWLLWLCGFLPAAAAVISPAETLPGKLVSLTAFLPGVLLLTGWHGSRARKGLMAILFRTEGAGAVRLSELLLPTLAGTVLGSLAGMAASFPPPWQFWLTLPLSAFAVSALIDSVERRYRDPGRFLLGLIWLYGASGSEGTGRSGSLLAPFGYPGEVLFSGEAAVHPDSFVLASLVLAGVSAGIYSLSCRS